MIRHMPNTYRLAPDFLQLSVSISGVYFYASLLGGLDFVQEQFNFRPMTEARVLDDDGVLDADISNPFRVRLLHRELRGLPVAEATFGQPYTDEWIDAVDKAGRLLIVVGPDDFDFERETLFTTFQHCLLGIAPLAGVRD